MHDVRDKAIEEALDAYIDAIKRWSFVEAIPLTINAYEAALNQPMKTAPKNGRYVLGWRDDIGIWTVARCVEGCKWPDGFTKWRPMPAPIEGDL